MGQGELLVTPVQVAGMMNAVVSGGVYSQPKLVEGLVDENKEFIQREEYPSGQRIISEENASLLMEYMEGSVTYGTGRQGRPTYLEADVYKRQPVSIEEIHKQMLCVVREVLN